MLLEAFISPQYLQNTVICHFRQALMIAFEIHGVCKLNDHRVDVLDAPLPTSFMDRIEKTSHQMERRLSWQRFVDAYCDYLGRIIAQLLLLLASPCIFSVTYSQKRICPSAAFPYYLHLRWSDECL
jgi:hypothetical protein